MQEATRKTEKKFYRIIHVKQKSYYVVWIGYIFITLFIIMLTIGYISNPDASSIQGRRAFQLKLLIYSLPVLWPLVIGYGLWIFFVIRKNYPRVIEIEDARIQYQYRDNTKRTFNVDDISEIKEDRYGNLHMYGSDRKRAFSIPIGSFEKEDQNWMNNYIHLLREFLERRAGR